MCRTIHEFTKEEMDKASKQMGTDDREGIIYGWCEFHGYCEGDYDIAVKAYKNGSGKAIITDLP